MNRPSAASRSSSGVTKAHGAPVVSNFSAIVNWGEKIILVGRNGPGKTTLLKALRRRPIEQRRPREIDSGTVKWGHEIDGYSRRHTGAIQKGMTAVEWLHQPTRRAPDIHGRSADAVQREGPADGVGRRDRACCSRRSCRTNALVLDEPTNHLDLESINAVNVALQKFEGTVLLVTHDQDVMEEVGTRVWHFDHDGISDFKGTFEEYEASVAQ